MQFFNVDQSFGNKNVTYMQLFVTAFPGSPKTLSRFL